MSVNPVVAGLMCRCPNCGEGPLFEGFLKVTARCEACGFDLSKSDSGDGPAVFVILIAGFLVGFAFMITAINNPYMPVWLHLIIWLPLMTVVSLGLMRPVKGVLVAAQFHNKASQAGRDDI